MICHVLSLYKCRWDDRLRLRVEGQLRAGSEQTQAALDKCEPTQPSAPLRAARARPDSIKAHPRFVPSTRGRNTSQETRARRPRRGRNTASQGSKQRFTTGARASSSFFFFFFFFFFFCVWVFRRARRR